MSPWRPIEQRLREKVSLQSDDGCWIFTGAIDKKGYGRIGRGGKYGQIVLAHRLSWELYRGAIPDGLWVLHRCDVRACVNPSHLFLGTHRDNMDDMVSKGRAQHVRGAAKANVRFTEADVADMRRNYRWNEYRSQLNRELAAKYKISLSHLRAMVAGKSRNWLWISEPPRTNPLAKAEGR